ncbi:MAG TPA: hypothetical protein VJQ82_06915, partial [Terriglobales bacterium]|nr:hypothetical protein [Terriglobales bacterium]
MLETALPKCTDLAESVPHLYRNIVLALGKCALNTRTVEKLLNVSEPSFEALAATVQEDVPDILFQRLLKRLAEEPGILRTLLDIARRTPIEAGFASFEEFLAGAGDMPGDALANLVFTLDQRLMSQLGRTFEFIRGPGLDASERTDLINNFIGRWNAAFHERYGHTFAAVDKIEMRMTAQPRIRIMPSPSVASGERASSVTPLPMITQGDLVAGLDAAKTLGLWVHVRLFINPRDKTLSLGRTAPPLKPRCAVLVFAPCIPDSVRTGDDRLRFFELMRRNRGIPSMPTSLYIENDSLPELIRQLAKIPLLWHVDWIMYNFASAAGITVDELPGDKYIHMDNADDVTFFGVMEDLGANSKTEGYVQWFGNKTLLVATVYRVGKPIFYSIPLAEYKYSEFTGKL